MQILVDTNVLLRIVDASHSQHQLAVAAIDSIASRGHELCIVPQVIYEFWVVATRPIELNGLGLSATSAQERVADVVATFRLLRDERTIFEIWSRLVVDYQVVGKRAHDVRLVAAAIRHGISHFLTFNAADFSTVPQIEVIEPKSVDQLPPQA